MVYNAKIVLFISLDKFEINDLLVKIFVQPIIHNIHVSTKFCH